MVDEMEVIVAWYDSKWYLQHVLWFLSMITNLPVHQRYPKSSLEACSEKVFSRPESDQISFKTCREIRIWPNHSSVVSEHVVFCSSRDGIRKKPSFVLSLDTYRNQSWACFEPRRKAATARTGDWIFVKLRFVRFKGWSSRGDWTPGLERKKIFIKNLRLFYQIAYERPQSSRTRSLLSFSASGEPSQDCETRDTYLREILQISVQSQRWGVRTHY